MAQGHSNEAKFLSQLLCKDSQCSTSQMQMNSRIGGDVDGRGQKGKHAMHD